MAERNLCAELREQISKFQTSGDGASHVPELEQEVKRLRRQVERLEGVEAELQQWKALGLEDAVRSIIILFFSHCVTTRLDQALRPCG